MGDESIFLKMSDQKDENEGLNQGTSESTNMLPLPITIPADGFFLDEPGAVTSINFPK